MGHMRSHKTIEKADEIVKDATQEKEKKDGKLRLGRPVVDRSARVSTGGFHQKLTVNNLPDGVVPRWTTEKNIEKRKGQGYMFLHDPDKESKVGDGDKNNNTDLGSTISMVTDSETGEKSYLMAQAKEFYDDDQRAKQSKIDEIEDAIKNGTNNKIKNAYIPKGHKNEIGMRDG